MNIQKINWKIYLKNQDQIDVDDWFKGFAQWIENSPEVFVDVADYKHVHDGPLAVLIGYACDYWLDGNNHRKGLLYNQRQPLEGNNGDRLRQSFKALLDTTERIENDKEFGNTDFASNEFLFLINDRLAAPNNAETFAAVKKELDEAFKGLFDIEHNDNTRERFSVNLKAKSEISLKELREKLAL